MHNLHEPIINSTVQTNPTIPHQMFTKTKDKSIDSPIPMLKLFDPLLFDNNHTMPHPIHWQFHLWWKNWECTSARMDPTMDICGSTSSFAFAMAAPLTSLQEEKWKPDDCDDHCDDCDDCDHCDDHCDVSLMLRSTQRSWGSSSSQEEQQQTRTRHLSSSSSTSSSSSWSSSSTSSSLLRWQKPSPFAI